VNVGKMKTGCCLLAFLLFLLQAQTALAQLYSVTDLGDLPGGSDSSIAHAINNLGTVVGESHGIADGDYTDCGFGDALKPFIWTAAGGIQTLGPTPTLNIFTNPLKPCGGGALGTNDQGEVVGYLDYGFAGGTRGFIWSAGNGMQLIDPQRAQGATDINNGGQVVGPTGGGAYRWSVAGGFEGLFGSGTVPWAAAINNLGVTVGVLQGGRYIPVFWDAAGTLRFMNGIPDDNLSAETRSEMGINDLGEIVGRVCNSPTSPLFRADGCDGFFWSSVSGALNLGELPTSGSHHTGGFGINSSSQVVGSSNGRAFLWTVAEGIRDLNSLLDQTGAGWTLISANAINDVGQIVGYGDHNGLTRAFLLTPVPTATPVLAVSPSALDFSGVNVGSSKDLSFTVQNTGGGTLTGSASTSAPFSIVGDNSFSLAGGQSKTITVRFSPTSATTFNGNVSVTSNGGNASVMLTGTGTAATSPAVGISSNNLIYGEQRVGTSSTSKRVTITNTGSANLILGTLTITGTASGDFLLITDSCTGLVLSPKTTCTFDVTFLPTAVGTRSGNVRIPSNATGSPHFVSLTGIGIANFCVANISDPAFDIAFPLIKRYVKRVFQVSNIAEDTLKAVTWGEFQGTPLWKVLIFAITVDDLLRQADRPIDRINHELVLVDLANFTTEWGFTTLLSQLGPTFSGVAAWASLGALPITNALQQFARQVKETALENQIKLYILARDSGCSENVIRNGEDNCLDATLSFTDDGWLHAVATTSHGTLTCGFLRACYPRPLTPSEVYQYAEALYLQALSVRKAQYLQDRTSVGRTLNERIAQCSN